MAAINQRFSRIAKKVLKISGITIASLLALMFVGPMLFPDYVSDKIKAWVKDVITSELNFSKARLSFFNHFPALTLTLYDFSLKGSAPFEQDTLVAAKEIALGIDLYTLLSERIRIDQVFLTRSTINVLVDSAGNPNYAIYQPDTTVQAATPDDSSGTSLKIERIVIEHSNLLYKDASIPIVIAAKELNYEGKGDLSKAIFDLDSHIEVDSFDLEYEDFHYIGSKKLDAELVTRINTNSLAFVFERNDLKLNDLPLDFTGKFEFLEKGYNMEFRLQSKKGSLHDVFTALPPEYMPWVDNTNARGKVEMEAYLIGQYITETNTMPDLGFTMNIRDGYINYSGAPSPVKNLFLNFDTKLPALNTDSLYVNIDSIFFNIDQDYFSSIIKLNNLNRPEIHARINSEIDLEKWDKAFGMQPFDLKGHYSLHLVADGKYATTVKPEGIRGIPDTVISSIPVFKLESSLTNGYFKYADLPQAISNMSFQVNAGCADSNYRNATFAIENINATVINNLVKGYVRFSDFTAPNIDALLTTKFNLADIAGVYPMDSVQLKGILGIDISAKGIYAADKKQFPVTTALFSLQNGSVKTAYYPNPIDQIQVSAKVTNTTGNLRDLQVQLQPVSFNFEGQPFTIQADFQNPENLRYALTSKGTIDAGKLYSVFAQEGYEVKGFIKTDLSLRGLQSDAVAGRYSKLKNSGTAELKDISLSSQYFPLPFVISTGLFRFEQDKIWFDKFIAHYGKSTISLDGYLSNIINYALADNAPLKGRFDLKSDYLLVDEFMAYASGGDSTTTLADSAATGVVLIPANLDLLFTANAEKIEYSGLMLEKFKGSVAINNSRLTLNKTGFTLIGAPVSMEGSYASSSPTRANFEYHITAKEFDVKRAYNEIPIFHELASSASSAEGIVSLDYTLSGKLDENMYPVYPSLKGGGVLSLKQVKINGLKLFSAVSKATEKDSINNPELSQVNIKTRIANNIITLERTKMKIFGFRPRFEGQVSFDGKLNLTGRLGLPPFGILGIPFTVTGTQDNPAVQLRRQKDTDQLEETTEEVDSEE